MPLRTGLVSVTFRKLMPAEIVAAVAAAGLDGIEWGGDVHVPHGNLAAARDVAARTHDAGLAVAAYGSYYRNETPDLPFARVLETAVALDAPTVRVWAGMAGSASADAAAFARVADDLAAGCDLAATAGRTVTLEYHGGTLTDTLDATVRLLEAIARPNLRTGWQPRDGATAGAGVAELHRLRPWLGNIHVFQWWPNGQTRHPLAAGRDRWAAYLTAAAEPERFALLEFVRNDALPQFAEDAACLRALLGR